MDAEAEEILGEILRGLEEMPDMRFNEILNQIRKGRPRISPRRLTKILRSLVDDGRVVRTVNESWPPHARYTITGFPGHDCDGIRTIVLDKYCPICVKSRLKAWMSPSMITIKCQNPDCAMGGDPHEMPYYCRGPNPFPDWKKEGVDVFDILYELASKKVDESALDFWSKECMDCGSSKLRVQKSGPMYDKECMDCGHASGGVPFTAWSLPEGITFLRNHPRVRDGWIAQPVGIDGVKCWAVTCLDLDANHRLTTYANYKTFRPVKLVIDYHAKPLAGEKTAEEMVAEFLG